ncbi:UDP-N-acetylmuramoyl-L-alanine--D-glutamate ligase [Candidatus Fermentibacteria bacterium]|nr:MAG: UDP-N-acetylmuramoyl-L-alanine--D-glutamate ligase [Candidatus Fermentibacteria bacterium]
MISIPSGKGMTAGVAGMGRSGAAASRLLASLGYSVVGFDSSMEAAKPEHVSRLITGVPSAGDINQLSMMVLSPGVPPDSEICRMCRDKGVPLAAEVELAWAATSADILAVTGSNGKTTTVIWASQVLGSDSRFHGAKAAGNVGYAFSDAVLDNPDCPVFVLELSSYQLEMIQDLKASAAVFLNLTPDHLARHGTMEAYGDAKARIFMNQNKDDTSILNLDDPGLERFKKDAGGKVMLFSAEKPVEHGAWVDSEGYLTLSISSRSTRVIHKDRLPLPGRHNLSNALAVVCLCAACGMNPEGIGEALPRFRGVAHRLENLGEHRGVQWINDSKSTNVDSLKVALESMSRKVILLAGGQEKESDYSVLSSLLREKTCRIILFGSGGEALQKQWMNTVPEVVVNNLEEAVEKALEVAAAGDIVLLSPGCASFDQYRNFEERGEDFREIVGGIQ